MFPGFGLACKMLLAVAQVCSDLLEIVFDPILTGLCLKEECAAALTVIRITKTCLAVCPRHCPMPPGPADEFRSRLDVAISTRASFASRSWARKYEIDRSDNSRICPRTVQRLFGLGHTRIGYTYSPGAYEAAAFAFGKLPQRLLHRSCSFFP